MVKFQYNNHVHASIQQTPFLLDTEQTPYIGFEPRQHPSRLETVNKFMEQMKAAVEEVKAMIKKVQEDIMQYYNQRRSLAPVFYPGDQVFLNVTNIKTIYLSPKLSYYYLRPFVVEQQVGPLTYCLKLLYAMKKLYPIFNIVKLSSALDNPILERRPKSPLPSVVIDREEKQEVEEILESHWHRREFQFLVKWKGFGKEHNSWCYKLHSDHNSGNT